MGLPQLILNCLNGSNQLKQHEFDPNPLELRQALPEVVRLLFLTREGDNCIVHHVP